MSERLDECFRLLELSSSAGLDEVRKSYRELVKVWHPDRFPNDPGLRERATEKVKLLNLAYETIIEHFRSNQSSPEDIGEKGKDTRDSSVTRLYDDEFGCWRYSQTVIKQDGFDGRVRSETQRLMVSRPVSEGISFEVAASKSMSFQPQAENLGSPTRHCDFAPDGERISGYDWQYSFPDNSCLVIAHVKIDSKFGILEPLREQWANYSKSRSWNRGLEVGQEFVKAAPEDVSGYLYSAIALHMLGETPAALDLLRMIESTFPKDEDVIYNMALYECRLGRIPNAKRLIKRLVSLTLRDGVKRRVLADADFAPLHKWVNSFWF